MHSTYYEYRPVGNSEELLALLKLEHRVYCASRLAGFVDATETEFEIDEFDMHAWHLGLFRIDEEGMSRIVGFHRPIWELDGPMRDEVLKIAKTKPHTLRRLQRPLDFPLPFVQYWAGPNPMTHLYWDVRAHGGRVMEGTRMGIEEEERTLRLSVHIVESGLALGYFFFGMAHVIAGVCSRHVPFYRRYGFEPAPGMEQKHIHGIPGTLLLGSWDTVPTHVKERLHNRAEAYRTTGRICYKPMQPENYYAPECEAKTKAA